MGQRSILDGTDLFIFDWDGTLNDMRVTLRINEAIKRSLHVWNRDSGIKDFKRVNYELKKKLRGEERRNNVMTFLFDMFLNLSRPRLHKDSIALIDILRKKGKRIAIFSNGRGSRIVRELRILGIADRFDSIVSARDINALKPNPTGLKAVLASTKVRPGRAVYIGDMVDDIITAKLAHVKSCAVADGFDSYHTLKSIKPDCIYRSIAEFYNSIR